MKTGSAHGRSQDGYRSGPQSRQAWQGRGEAWGGFSQRCPGLLGIKSDTQGRRDWQCLVVNVRQLSHTIRTSDGIWGIRGDDYITQVSNSLHTDSLTKDIKNVRRARGKEVRIGTGRESKERSMQPTLLSSNY